MVVAEQLVGCGATPALAVGVVIAIADPSSDVTSPSGTLAHQRAQTARMATQRQG